MIQELDSLLDEPFKREDDSGYAPFRYYPPPCQVSKDFKRELTAIGGRTPDGRPRLRIQWGMDVTWMRNGKRVPRYVMSRDIVRREEQTPAGIWVVIETPVFWGDPHFVIEEWKGPEHFRAPGVSEDEAEEMWERQRYRVEEEEWEVPSKPFASEDELKEFVRAMSLRRPILSGDGNGNVIQVKIDVMGPFPRSGRYDYLTKLRPAGAHPNDEWLEIIRESFWRRSHRKFATVDDELNDLNEEMAARTQQSRQESAKELEHNLWLQYKAEEGEPGLSQVFTHPTDKGANV